MMVGLGLKASDDIVAEVDNRCGFCSGRDPETEAT